MSYIKSLLVCLLTALAVLFSVEPLLAFADAEALVSVPDDVKVGSSFDITLTFTADESIGWFETNLTYDSKLLEFVSGEANGGEGVLHLRCFPDTEQQSISVTLTFSALKEGRAELSIMNCSVFSPDGVPLSNPTASAAVNILGSEQSQSPDVGSSSGSSDTDSTVDSQDNSDSSSDADTPECLLKSLRLSAGELAPAFSPDIFDYTVKLESGINKVEVMTELGSINDFIWFECSSWLSDTEDGKRIIVNMTDSEVKLKITVKDRENDPTVSNIYRIIFVPEAVEENPSESAEDTSSVTPDDSLSAAITSAPEESLSDDTSASSAPDASLSEPSGMAELRDKLMPWLLLVLLVLIIALILVIYWIRSRTDRKRRKIKSSGGRK